MSDSIGEQSAVKLSKITEPGVYLVVKVEGAEPELRRFNQIGLMPGARLEVVSYPQDDMMVIKAGGGRMAVARGTTKNVWVRARQRS